jgi:hypothetical protein
MADRQAGELIICLADLSGKIFPVNTCTPIGVSSVSLISKVRLGRSEARQQGGHENYWFGPDIGTHKDMLWISFAAIAL